MNIKWTKYIPHTPTGRQLAFLSLPHKEAFFGGAAGGGKSDALLMGALQYPLSVDTKVWTTKGFKTIGTLCIGDEVYDLNGQVTKVCGKTQNFKKNKCYKVIFSDRTEIIADEYHEWMVHDFTDRMSIGVGYHRPLRRKTTKQLFESQKTKHKHPQVNYSIPVCCPLKGTKQNLIVDPYLLGVWLGDGSAQRATISGIDQEIFDAFESAGYSCKYYTPHSKHPKGFKKDLTKLGIRDYKYVPQQYLQATEEDRLSLLQGLMDTDGSIDRGFGCRFFNTNKELIDTVAYLVRSFGWIPYITTQKYTTPAGEKKKGQLVWFTSDKYVFRLKRKRDIQPISTKKHRTIREIVEIDPAETACISTESGTFLASESLILTHNCDTPGYKALIIRRSIADMLLPSSILSRAKEWLKPYIDSGEVKYRPGQNHTFTFPSGAEIACGYLENAGTEKRYQGSEYTYIAFDELTHFQKDEYVYLFSRLRKEKDSAIPSRVRSASNPGGVGMKWVKDRFKIHMDDKGNWVGGNPDAPFIPSKCTDNPHINVEDYADSLNVLGTVAREQLKEGNWDINEEAIYDPKWFQDRYTIKSTNGNYILVNKNGMRWYRPDDLMIFTTIDCAASVKTGVKHKSYHKTKKTSSWSVCATWGVTPQYDLLWLDNVRLKTTIPNFVERIIQNQHQWKPLFNIIEKNGPGEGVYQFCEKKGLPMDPIHTRPEKIVNSVAAQLAAEQGKIWLPTFAPWLKDLEDELFLWTGDPLEEDDQIDVLSNAANKRMYEAVGYEKSWGLRNGTKRAKPFSQGSLYASHSGSGLFMGYSPLA